MLLFPTGDPIDFNITGLTYMAVAEGLRVNDAGAFPAAQQASLILSPAGLAAPPPCQRMNDGSRLYVVRGVVNGLNVADMRVPGRPGVRYTLICPGRPPLVYP